MLLILVAFKERTEKTITVERINIVEPDGKLRMVLSNRATSPGNLHYGKEFIKGGNSTTVDFLKKTVGYNGKWETQLRINKQWQYGEDINRLMINHEKKDNKEVFWISKKTSEVLKLEQEISGRLYQYKIKLGFSI